MISFRCFIKNKFLILEDRFVDNYWFKISHEELLQILDESKLSLEKNLFLVTKNSEHSDIYKDDYKFPVTIYCEKEKIISFIKDNDYNSSLTKKSIFSEAKEEEENDTEEDGVLEDSEVDEGEPSLEDSEDLFSSGDAEEEELNVEEPSNPEEETPKDEEEPPSEEEPKEEEADDDTEPPDEISINENSIELDVNIILAIEVNLTGISFFLDKETSKFIKLLNMKISTKNKPDDVIRKQIAEVYKEKVISFSEQNNITTNFIEE
jgi:hypothetical protein